MRIREQLAGLAALGDVGGDEPDERPVIWDRVMEEIKQPRLQLYDVDLDASNS